MRNRILLSLALALGVTAAFLVGRYLHSPLYAVRRIEAAYAKGDAAAARKWLTPRGLLLFQAGIDPDFHSSILRPRAEPAAAAPGGTTVRYRALTRFGAVDADLRLVRPNGSGQAPWRLDEVYLHAVGSLPVEEAASSLLGLTENR